MSNLKLYCFGPPRLTVEGEPVELPRRKVMALLCYLTLTGQAHNRDWLATLLWPESSQQAVRGALRRELHVLNKQFGASCFRTSWEMVGIAPTAVIWNDVAIFRQLVAKEIQQSQAESVLSTAWKDDLLAATALYTGDFLAGFSLPDAEEFEAWQRFEAERLRRAFTGALANVIQWYRQQGNYSAAIPHALRWLAMDTLHEPAHRALMELYAMAGDATAALRHYDECQRILQQELGVPPAAETTALYDSIRNRHVVPPIEKTDPLPPPPVATAFSPTAPPTAQPRIPSSVAGWNGSSCKTAGPRHNKTARIA
ncbi:MAG: BTAD domain-containing putative transcriptional regulator [Caldilineaceae bacterium]